MTRTTPFLVLCILAGCASVQAETVMISLLNDEGSEFITEERVEYASSIVNGAMEQFFEANHIVFNAAFTTDAGAAQALEVAKRVAKQVAIRGGAGILFSVLVGGSEPALLAPIYVQYSLLDILADRVIAEGSVKLDEVLAGEKKTAVRACFLLGMHAAAESARVWSLEQ
jgi:hypothetical protein